jgi:hypothetical protein
MVDESIFANWAALFSVEVADLSLMRRSMRFGKHKDWPTYQGTLQVPDIQEWKEQKELAKKMYESYKGGKEINDTLQSAADNAFRNCTPQ